MCALLRFACAFTALSLLFSPGVNAEEGRISWEQLPDLPPTAKGTEQKGLAGLYGGIHGDVLILAGGANFPVAAPWKSGVKNYWNDIYVLEKTPSGKTGWVKEIKTKLPKPIAYGASVSTEKGVVCIGGADASQCYTDVFLLKWNKVTRDVDIEKLPPLPVALAHSTAALVGNVIYVAGGVANPFAEGTKAFFALDLDPQPTPRPEIEDPENLEEKPSAKDKEKPGDETGESGTLEPKPEESEPGNKEAKTTGSNPSNLEKWAADKEKLDSEKPAESVPETSIPDSDTKDTEPENSDNPEDDPKADPSEPKPIKPEVIEEPDDPKRPVKPKEGEKEKEEEDEKPEPAVEPVPLKWKELDAWDGKPRAFAVSVAQSDGEKNCFFLFSGRNPKSDGTSELLVDAHKYDPVANQWIKFPDIALPDENPRSVVAASASANGERSILIYGGDDGTMAKVSALVVAAANSTSKDAYLKLNETILENHPGFSRDVLSLDTVDAVWTNVATFPESCPVTTPAILWDESVVIPSGEIRPGVRSPKIWKGTWKSK